MLLVTSTSWTPDEDIGLLLDAVASLDTRLRETGASGRRLLVVITGKGPMLADTLPRLRRMNETLSRAEIRSVWLEAADYPRLLGSADVGVSLHTSSSGLDLPMKIVDMFGCKLPVCAISFRCLGELVQHEVNGYVFTTAEQLADQLFSLVTDLDSGSSRLTAMRSSISMPSWAESWGSIALPFFQSFTATPSS